MEWGEALKLAATAGIFAAVINQGLTWIRDGFTAWRKKTASASYLAIRIAVVLEAFVEECGQAVTDIGNYESSNGAIGGPVSSIPKIGAFPADDESWRALDLVLTQRALSLPNKIPSGQRAIDFDADVGDEGDARRRCLEECCKLSLEAWDLAADLRKRYKFAAYDPGYDCTGFLRDQAVRAAEFRRREADSNAGMWNMNATEDQTSMRS